MTLNLTAGAAHPALHPQGPSGGVETGRSFVIKVPDHTCNNCPKVGFAAALKVWPPSSLWVSGDGMK